MCLLLRWRSNCYSLVILEISWNYCGQLHVGLLFPSPSCLQFRRSACCSKCHKRTRPTFSSKLYISIYNFQWYWKLNKQTIPFVAANVRSIWMKRWMHPASKKRSLHIIKEEEEEQQKISFAITQNSILLFFFLFLFIFFSVWTALLKSRFFLLFTLVSLDIELYLSRFGTSLLL